MSNGTLDLSDVRIATRGDHVEVTGADEEDIRRGLELVTEEDERRRRNLDPHDAHRRQGQAAAELESAYLRRLEEPGSELTDTQRVAVARAVAHRRALVGTPTYTYADMAKIRGVSPTAIRSRVHRRPGQVLTVTVAGRVLLPAFQFNEYGELQASIAEINTILKTDDTMDDWARWAWWRSTTSLLSGQSPLDVVEENVERVRTAARRTVRRHVA